MQRMELSQNQRHRPKSRTPHCQDFRRGRATCRRQAGITSRCNRSHRQYLHRGCAISRGQAGCISWSNRSHRQHLHGGCAIYRSQAGCTSPNNQPPLALRQSLPIDRISRGIRMTKAVTRDQKTCNILISLAHLAGAVKREWSKNSQRGGRGVHQQDTVIVRLVAVQSSRKMSVDYKSIPAT